MAEIKEIFSTEDAKAQKTIDGFDNFVARVGLNSNNVASEGSYTFNLLTRNRVQLEAAYRGSWIVGQIVEAVADDMTRAGIDITTNDDDEEIKDVQATLSRLSIWKSLNSLEKWGRLYGGAIAVIQIKGQKLDTPLDVQTVGEGQFQGLCVYDRWQLNPSLNEVIEDGIDMGLPKFYSIVTTASNATLGGTDIGEIKVHHSRVIRSIGIELPFFQALTEMMWGESVLERLWDRLIPFDQVTMSAANLIERANNRTIGIEGLREIIAAGGKAEQGLMSMLEMIRQFQTNEGLTIIDKNDSWATSNYTFAGLADLIMQYGQQLAGASQIPLVRLFGQSPAGLSATGESDIRLYYDSINARQEAKFRHGIELILKVIWRSKFGKDAPKDLEFTFTSLWQMSATDKATIAKTNAETIAGAHDAGLISTPAAMKELRDTSGDTGMFANISDEDIADAEEMDENPPAPELDASKLDDPEEPPPNQSKDAAFKESEHPRKKDGEFGKGGSGSNSKKASKESIKKPNETESKAIRFYTGSQSSQFIEADKGNEVDQDIASKNKELNSYLDKATKYKGDIHRGIVVEKSEVDSILAKYAEGKSVKTEAKQSWTKDPKSVETRLTQVAKEKKDPVKIVFEYPDSAAGVDISEHSRFPEEQEVVVPKESSYKVKKVEKSGDGYKVIFESAGNTGDAKTLFSDLMKWLRL